MEIAGLGLVAIALAGGVTVINLLGTGLSAATITTSLAAIGALLGGGMVVGIVMVFAGGVFVGKFCV